MAARLHDEIHMTSVFVTDDQEEAFEVADEVVVMNGGRIEQAGIACASVRLVPANRFVMDFLGNVNVFHKRVQNGQALMGDFSVAYPDYPHDTPQPATAYVRPHELEIHRAANGVAAVEAQVQRINPAGSVVKVGLTTGEENGAFPNVDLGPAARRAATSAGRARMGFRSADAGVHARRRRLHDLSRKFLCRKKWNSPLTNIIKLII